MFEAGSIIWRIQTVGKQVLKQDLAESEAAANKAAGALGGTAKETEELGKKSQQVRPHLRGVATEIGGMSQEAQQAAGTVGRAMFVIGAAVVAAAGLTVKAARDWESAWTGVTKTVDENAAVVGGSYREIESGLRDLAKELPATHSEIAAVAEAAGQLGVRAEDIVRFTRTMIDLGETTNLTADEAATSLAQLMNIMQTAPEDVGRLGAAVVALGNDGASTERDIVQMAQRIAGAANIIGLTEGETLGLANALASVGIEAEAGGSSVSNIMIDISNAVSSKGSKLLEWSKLAGLSADEFAERWRTSPAEALSLVVEGMGRLNASGGDVFATLSKLGQTDIRVTRALLNLAGAGTLLHDSLELGNKSWGEQLALQAEADKRYATAAAKLDMARNSVTDMAIELGQHLLPAVVAAAEGVGDFADMVGGLPDGVQAAVSVTTALAGVVILVGAAAILAVPKIVAFRQAVATLATEMPKTLAAGRAVAAFLTGPWGVALGVAALGLITLDTYLKSTRASSDEMTAALKRNRSAADILATFSKGLEFGGSSQLDDLDNVLTHFAEFQNASDRWAKSGNAQAFRSAFDTLDQLGTKLAEVARSDMPEAQQAFNTLAAETDGSEQQLWRLINAMPAFKQALIETGTENGIYAETMSDAEKKTALLALAQGEGIGVTQSAAAAYLDAQGEIEGMGQELDQLIDILNEANGVGQDAVSANADYQDALLKVDEAIKKARAGLDGYSLGLDQNTAAGSANMDMLANLAKDGSDAAAAQFELDKRTMGAQAATDLYRQRLEESQSAVLQRAKDLGATNEQLEWIRTNIAAIPPEHVWTLIAETAAAEETMQTFWSRWNNKQLSVQATASLNYAIHSGSAGSIPRTSWPQANGGVVEFFASGGIRENHVAQLVRGGDVRVWNEPETGGEAYIPLTPTKRARSLQVLAETADRFGLDVVPRTAARLQGPPSDPEVLTTHAPTRIEGELTIAGTGLRGFIRGVITEEIGHS